MNWQEFFESKANKIIVSFLIAIVLTLVTYLFNIDLSTNKSFPSGCRGLPICWYEYSTKELAPGPNVLPAPQFESEIFWPYFILDILIWTIFSYFLILIINKMKRK